MLEDATENGYSAGVEKDADTVSMHTPGPWRVTTCMDYWVQAGEVGVALCGDLDWTAEDSNCVRDQREMGANARLIAAAPDLLRAAQAALDSMDEYQDSETIEAAKLLRAAIAKATSPQMEEG